MSIDTATSWDTQAINVDKYGPIDEEPVSTLGRPLEAAVYFSNFDYPRYCVPSKSPFDVIKSQTKRNNIGYRNKSVSVYLSQVFEEATCDRNADRAGDDAWREVNHSLQPIHFFRADLVRDHFISRFTLQKMKDLPLNTWQEEVFDIVCRDDQRAFKQREIGIISTLVQAYENDLEIERCVSNWGEIRTDSNQQQIPEQAATVVGGYNTLSSGGISLFALLEDSNTLVEIHLDRSSTNQFFLDQIERMNYQGFKIMSFGSTPLFQLDGKSWLKARNPKISLI